VDAERWKVLNDLFHGALGIDPARRSPWLDEACGGDQALRAEAVSLLDAHARAGDFIEAPAAHVLAAESAVPGEPAGEPDPLVGRQIGQYRILEKLGQGGMGVVYLAEDTRLGRTVAIKALRPTATHDSRQRERLRREAQTAAALSHPGIAMVYALEEFGDDLYIVGEYVPGRTLREELADGPLPIARVIDTAVDVARALAAAHEHGVVHRDLKPENIIRSRDGRLKILDFGLARSRDGSLGSAPGAVRLTETGAILGTPAYMSPEQLRGEDVDFRADVFAFGVLMYELTTGVHPFAGSSSASTIVNVLESRPPDIVSLQPSSPPALDAIVLRCLEKDPAGRFGATRDLVRALEDLRRDPARPVVERPVRHIPIGLNQEASGVQNPLWWWQFHQLIAGLIYTAMLVPLWLVLPWLPTRAWGLIVFFAGVVAGFSATTLRLHLWFTSRVYPAEWAAQRNRTSGWIRLADSLFVALLGMAGLAILSDHQGTGSFFIAVAVATLIAFTVVEPATTRAAFRK
jgi:serine/threonine protein kinase